MAGQSETLWKSPQLSQRCSLIIAEPSTCPTTTEDNVNQDRKVCCRIRVLLFSCLRVIERILIIFHRFNKLPVKGSAKWEIFLSRMTSPLKDYEISRELCSRHVLVSIPAQCKAWAFFQLNGDFGHSPSPPLLAVHPYWRQRMKYSVDASNKQNWQQNAQATHFLEIASQLKNRWGAGWMLPETEVRRSTLQW